MIEGNKEEVSKSGKLLINLITEQNMALLNKNKKCQGKWTRISGKEKSILDYSIILEEDEKYVETIEIDEDKIHTPKYNDGKRDIFTDHCAIITEIKWIDANIANTKANSKMIVDDKSLMKFKQNTEKGRLTEIVQKQGNLSDTMNWK